jgi:hypothetical protein
MNLVGKIFTLLIFVMSLVFMAFTVAVYSTHRNWREVVLGAPGKPDTGLDFKLGALKAKNDELAKERDKYIAMVETEKANAAQARAKLESENVDLKTRLAKTQLDADSKREQLRDTTGRLQAAQEKLVSADATIKKFLAEILEAQQQRDAKHKEVVQLTDSLHAAQNDLKQHDERSRKLGEEYAKALEVLRKFKLKPEPGFYVDIPPSYLKGMVLATEPGLVEISVGDDDGLLAGHDLEVYRGSGRSVAYVGRVKVLRTSPDRAVARIDEKMKKSAPQPGDFVAARLEN